MKIEATVVPTVERLAFLPKLFGVEFMMRAEAMLYNYAGQFAPDSYKGGIWDFYTLSNGGGYAAPRTPEQLNLNVDGNGFEGDMSADAAGIVFTMFVLNQLCYEAYQKDASLTEKLSGHYHQLRDFAKHHKEASSIFRAID
ncbi:antirestriction protein [Paraburkholderia sp. BR10882]|uniref:antirestriction protein n=1 Tax=unclassified Paraburkholderia TaxID=2615204 RepID=UPI0034CD228E